MRKDNVVYFEDILESIQKIEEYTNTITKEKFSDVEIGRASCRERV